MSPAINHGPAVRSMRGSARPSWGNRHSVRIDRATKWGNPYPVSTAGSRERAIALHAHYLRHRIEKTATFRHDLRELAQADEVWCWCAPRWCHGNTLSAGAYAAADTDQAWKAWVESLPPDNGRDSLAEWIAANRPQSRH